MRFLPTKSPLKFIVELKTIRVQKLIISFFNFSNTEVQK